MTVAHVYRITLSHSVT